MAHAAPTGATEAAAEAEEEELAPAQKTVAERLRGLRIVRGALSEATQKKMDAAGVPTDGGLASTAAPVFKGLLVDDDVLAAATKAKSTRLGLDGVAGPRVKAPQAMPTAPRLPVCSLDMKQSGLWDKFRLRCGLPLAADGPPALPCELRTSRRGGSVLVISVANAVVKG